MIVAMRITVNGEAQEIPDGCTVAALIERLELSGRRVAVEVNREIVRRAEHADHALVAGDQVEVVTLVGGG